MRAIHVEVTAVPSESAPVVVAAAAPLLSTPIIEDVVSVAADEEA